MKYDISKQKAPEMPNLGKGTECIKILLSQASKDMYEPLIPMFFPILGAHISGTEFQYPDYSWKETTGMMANLVAHSGDNKGQLTTLAKALCLRSTRWLSVLDAMVVYGAGNGCFARRKRRDEAQEIIGSYEGDNRLENKEKK